MPLSSTELSWFVDQLVPVAVIPLHVVIGDQILDSLLDVGESQFDVLHLPVLLHLLHQRVKLHSTVVLHQLHDDSIHYCLPVLLDHLIGVHASNL